MADPHRDHAPGIEEPRRQGTGSGAPSERYPRAAGLVGEFEELRLPWAVPALAGYDIAGWYLPAEETGGDFFDFREPGAGRLAVALGDVSGHGSGPALVAATCQALLRAALTESDDPEQVITKVNQLLCQQELDDRFVTAFFGVLRHEHHRLDYVSAGQGPILFFSRGTGLIEELVIQGFPLGLGPGLAFGPPGGVVFAPGDFLALITDGFFEWFNDAGECYGIERAKAQLAHDRDAPAREIIRRLYASVLHFAGTAPQPDDLTAVLIKRLGPSRIPS